jgi:hypothetical protein
VLASSAAFRHAHHVVTGDDFFRAVIRHANDAAAFSHQRRCGARELRQRVGADLECGEKRFAAGVEVFAAERFARREGDAVNQEVEPAKLLADLSKRLVDFFLFRDVAGEQQRAGHRFVRQAFDVFFQAIALVSESEVAPAS